MSPVQRLKLEHVRIEYIYREEKRSKQPVRSKE